MNNLNSIKNRSSSNKIKRSITFDAISAFEPVLLIFFKTLIYLYPEHQPITHEKKSLTELELISWDAVLKIRKSLTNGEHRIISDDLLLKYNLAHFFVKSIETSDQLIHQDLTPLIRSCLIDHTNEVRKNLTREIFNFIIELEAHRFTFSSAEYPDHDHFIDPSNFLFSTKSGRTQKDLLYYLKSLNCQSIRFGDHESALFYEISSAVSQEIVSGSENVELCKHRFSAPNLTNVCLALIRKLVQQDMMPTEASAVPILSEAPSETLKNLPYLTQNHHHKFPPSPSGSLSLSDESDEFPAENLIENPSPAKAVSPLTHLAHICQPSENLTSIGLAEGLALLPENSFMERHHQAVGPDSSEQGLIYKELRDIVYRNPEMFLNPSGTPLKDLNLPGHVTQSPTAPEHLSEESAHLAVQNLNDRDRISAKDSFDTQEYNSNSSPERNPPPPQDLNFPDSTLASEKPSDQVPPALSLSPGHTVAFSQERYTPPPPESDLMVASAKPLDKAAAELSHSPIHNAITFLQEHDLPSLEDLNSSGSILAAAKPTDKAPAELSRSPIHDTVAFRFNAPQQDASQIEFESLPTVGPNSSLAQDRNLPPVKEFIAPLPRSPAGQDRSVLKKVGSKTDSRLASSSKCNSNNQPKGLHRVTSGFLSSSSEESNVGTRQASHSPCPDKYRIVNDASEINQGESPPFRGKKRVTKPTATMNHAQSPVNQSEIDSSSPENERRHRRQSRPVSQTQRGRSISSDSRGSESNQEMVHKQGGKKKRKKSTSHLKAPVLKRKRRSSESDPIKPKQHESTPPSPIPVSKRKRKSSDEQPVENKRRPSKNKISERRRDAREKTSAPKNEKNFWTYEEEELLIKEVKRYYHLKNCMARIISRHGPNGCVSKMFAHRTSVNLKDKALNLSTRWHNNKIKISEKCKLAFARFPPKLTKKYGSESESKSESESESESESDHSSV